jgi:hypothetical protein
MSGVLTKGHCRQPTKMFGLQSRHKLNWRFALRIAAPMPKPRDSTHIQSFGIRAASLTVDCGTVHNTRFAQLPGSVSS